MKTTLLLLSIAAGIFLPFGYNYTFIVRYLLMLMLFFSFLDFVFDKKNITVIHFKILATIIFTSIIVFIILKTINVEMAEAVFIAAVGPTAIAAPVIACLKNGKVEFVVFSLVLNNIAIALLIPFLLPLLIGGHSDISVLQILFPVSVTLLIPFVLAQLIKALLPFLWKKLIKWKEITFYLLMLNIYIATSKASNYIINEPSDRYSTIFLIGLFTMAACAIMFFLGRIIGKRKYVFESSLSLGQKNNAFTIWIALTYMTPISVIGPVFYVIFQNIYISFELHRQNKKDS